MFELFDAHSHVNFSDFDIDRNEVVKRAHDAKIGMVVVGTCANDSLKAVKIADKFSGDAYASIGLHPLDETGEDFDVSYYRKLAKNPKVVAIGECGLDYFRIKNQELRTRQKEIFKKHLELAVELNKPLIIHCREARPLTPERSNGGRGHDDILDILKSYFLNLRSKTNGVVHFFSGTKEQANDYFDLGFLISFTGVITFARDYDEIIRESPLKKIIAETDAPFVAPVPYRGGRNEPLYVKEVVKKIAEIKNIPYEETARITTENALKLFSIE